MQDQEGSIASSVEQPAPTTFAYPPFSPPVAGAATSSVPQSPATGEQLVIHLLLPHHSFHLLFCFVVFRGFATKCSCSSRTSERAICTDDGISIESTTASVKVIDALSII